MDEEGEEELSINEKWIHIQAVVKEVAKEEIEVAECREAAKERNQARLLTEQNMDNLEMREDYLVKSRRAKNMNRRKKRVAMNVRGN